MDEHTNKRQVIKGKCSLWGGRGVGEWRGVSKQNFSDLQHSLYQRCFQSFLQIPFSIRDGPTQVGFFHGKTRVLPYVLQRETSHEKRKLGGSILI